MDNSYLGIVRFYEIKEGDEININLYFVSLFTNNSLIYTSQYDCIPHDVYTQVFAFPPTTDTSKGSKVSYQEDNICLYLLPWREGLYFKCFLIHYLCRDRWLAASVGGLHGVGSYIGDDESSHI